VKGRRCTRGIAALALVLGCCSVFFDDVALAIAAGSLGMFLAYRSLVFFRGVHRTAASFSISRETDNRLIRQGTDVAVATSLMLDRPSSLSLEITDLPPDGVRITDGTSKASIPPHTTKPDPLRYRFTHYTSGRMPFGGLLVTFTDPFFRTDIAFKHGEFREPFLLVFPMNAFEYENRDLYGEGETERRTPVSGYSIRSYREYTEGDPQKHIDWKLTAKFNKTIIREYMGREGYEPLLIVDLPDRNAAMDEAAFISMKEKVAAVLTAGMHRTNRPAIVVISGANIITLLREKTDLQQILQVVQDLKPADRLFHLYRFAETLRGRQIAQARDQGADGGFLSTLSTVEHIFSSSRQRLLFERQMKAALQSFPSGDIILFSMFEGDTSHLKLLALVAKEMRRSLRVYVPRQANAEHAKIDHGRYPFTSVEEIA